MPNAECSGGETLGEICIGFCCPLCAQTQLSAETTYQFKKGSAGAPVVNININNANAQQGQPMMNQPMQGQPMAYQQPMQGQPMINQTMQ